MTFAGERANSFVFSTSGSAFVVALFALAGWACAAVSTFDPWLALAKLAIAGVHLAFFKKLGSVRKSLGLVKYRLGA